MKDAFKDNTDIGEVVRSNVVSIEDNGYNIWNKALDVLCNNNQHFTEEWKSVVEALAAMAHSQAAFELFLTTSLITNADADGGRTLNTEELSAHVINVRDTYADLLADARRRIADMPSAVDGPEAARDTKLN